MEKSRETQRIDKLRKEALRDIEIRKEIMERAERMKEKKEQKTLLVF